MLVSLQNTHGISNATIAMKQNGMNDGYHFTNHDSLVAPHRIFDKEFYENVTNITIVQEYFNF